MAEQLPLYLTGSYYRKQPGGGIPGRPSVFDSLANPPETGVEAEAASEDAAKALGVNDPQTEVRKDASRNRDRIRDFYDTSSILRIPEA